MTTSSCSKELARFTSLSSSQLSLSYLTWHTWLAPALHRTRICHLPQLVAFAAVSTSLSLLTLYTQLLLLSQAYSLSHNGNRLPTYRETHHRVTQLFHSSNLFFLTSYLRTALATRYRPSTFIEPSSSITSFAMADSSAPVSDSGKSPRRLRQNRSLKV